MATTSKPNGAIAMRVGTKIDTIELDVAISRTHTSELDITEHPVEEGADFIDHARLKSSKLTIEGLISNTPMNRAQMSRANETQGITTAPNDPPVQERPGFAEEAYRKLLELQAAGTLLTVVTRLRVYDNMLIASLTVPEDSRTGDALRFNATFQQVRIVSNKITQTVVTKEPKAKPKKDTGKQVAKPTTTEPEKSDSFLWRLKNGKPLFKF